MRSAALRAFREGLPVVGVVVATPVLWAVFHGQRLTLSLIGEVIGAATLGVALYEALKAVARRVRSRRAGRV